MSEFGPDKNGDLALVHTNVYSISLLRLKSVTRRFRHEFSSSSERSRCASLTSALNFLIGCAGVRRAELQQLFFF